MLAAAIGRVEVDRRRRVGAAERPVVAHVGPQPPGAGLALGEHRHGRVVGVDALGGEHVGADRLDQRHQGRRRGADPVGQRRDVERDALAGIGRALAGERQVQAVLGEQHMRQQLRARRARARSGATAPAAG